MITVADLFNKPKIILFPESRKDSFYMNCQAREKGIKEAHKTTLRSFNAHLRIFKEKETKFTKWEKEKIASCARNLGEYMEFLLGELDKTKIEKYCELADKMGDRFIPFIPDLVLIMVNSYQGAIETDLHWVTDLSLMDSIAISTGTFNFKKLSKYLPQKIAQIKEICKELEDIDFVKPHISSISEAIRTYKGKRAKSSTLLLLTTIEGLVRGLGIFLVSKQNLKVNPLDKKKYASLDSFIRKIPWKSDLQVNEIKYGLLTGNLSMNKLTKIGIITTSLTDRLGFLCRRFKENRNVILHGEETQYANPLNSFLNFSALKEVLLTIQEYQSIYKV